MAQDPFKYFRIEARELVDGLSRGVLALEQAFDVAALGKVLRLAHTLKGAARVVKFKPLADAAHALEDVLAPLRDAPGAIDKRALALLDEMTAALAQLDAPAPVAKPAVTTTVAAPRSVSSALDDVARKVVDGLADVQRMLAEGQPIARALREVRRDADGLRLAPASSIFATLERTARDAAAEQGKRVAFAAHGGEVRVDAIVLATATSALVQLVRNAVAHGIAASGHVTIAVALRGARVAFSCTDDGRGIDLAAVARAAALKGRTGDPLRLLLEGGISTAKGVTELAGRGIGLDVVRETAVNLSGELTARTGPAGTMFELVVPVSAAAIEVLAVSVDNRAFAIPVAAVQRVVRVEGAFTGATLSRLVGGTRGTAALAVMIDGVAIGVDALLGVEHAILRSLSPDLPVDPIVWGISYDDDARPQPVLEPAHLVAAARRLAPYVAPPPVKPRPILVVDDSLTTRMLEQSILEAAGFEVETAASAEEGLEKVERAAFGLVLVDVEMPGMDGFGFVETLRAHPTLGELPAVLVTSRDAPEDLLRGERVGASGYIVKGRFDQRELLALIGRLVPA